MALNSSTYGRTSTTVPDRKLRNSCDACATSKLKCSQDKPTCTRCAKRGLFCEYVVAKRGGRKSSNRSSISSDKNNQDTANAAMNDLQLSSLSSWDSCSFSNPGTDYLHSPELVQYATKPNLSASSSSSSGMLHDFFTPLDQTMSSTSTSTDTEPEFEDIFSTADFFQPGFDAGQNVSKSLSNGFTGFDDSVSELLGLSMSTSAPKMSTSPSLDMHGYTDFRTAETPCSCLVVALGLMKGLFPLPSNGCMSRATRGVGKSSQVPTVQAVIAQNETTIESVGTMLKCSCSQDGYLLSVMALIIFKVLGWYEAVARKSPGHSRQTSPFEQVLQSPGVVGNYCLEGDDSPRMAAQLVLSELHRVRRLVDQLSSKLRLQAAKNKLEAETEPPDSCALDNDMHLPLSSVMYDQLDTDLRKRLKTLSWEMINRLRRL
jgi:hypothetical protein